MELTRMASRTIRARVFWRAHKSERTQIQCGGTTYRSGCCQLMATVDGRKCCSRQYSYACCWRSSGHSSAGTMPTCTTTYTDQRQRAIILKIVKEPREKSTHLTVSHYRLDLKLKQSCFDYYSFNSYGARLFSKTIVPLTIHFGHL